MIANVQLVGPEKPESALFRTWFCKGSDGESIRIGAKE